MLHDIQQWAVITFSQTIFCMLYFLQVRPFSSCNITAVIKGMNISNIFPQQFVWTSMNIGYFVRFIPKVAARLGYGGVRLD